MERVACSPTTPPNSDQRPVVFRWYRFRPLKLRNDSVSKVQLNSIVFYNGACSSIVSLGGCKATNPGGKNTPGEGPDRILIGTAGNRATKWLDFNKQPLVIEFRMPTEVTHLAFRTANDDKRRDPVRFAIEGSSDHQTWHLLFEQEDEDYFVGRGESFSERLTWSAWFCLEDRGIIGEMSDQLERRDRYLCKGSVCQESRQAGFDCKPKSHARQIGYQWHYQLLMHLEQFHQSTNELLNQRLQRERFNAEDNEWRQRQHKSARCVYEGPQLGHVRPTHDSAAKRRRLENLFGTHGQKKVRVTTTVHDAFKELVLLGTEVGVFARRRCTESARASGQPSGPIPNPNLNPNLNPNPNPNPTQGHQPSVGSPTFPALQDLTSPTPARSSDAEVEEEDTSDFEAAVRRYADTARLPEVLAVLGDTSTELRAKTLLAKLIVDRTPFPVTLDEAERRKQVEECDGEGRMRWWLWVLCHTIAYPARAEEASMVRLDLLNVMMLNGESPWVCLFGVLRLTPSAIHPVLEEVMPFLGHDEKGKLFVVKGDSLSIRQNSIAANTYCKGKKRESTFPIPFCVQQLMSNAKGFNAALPLGALFGSLLKDEDEDFSLAIELGHRYLQNATLNRRYAIVACFLTAIVLVKNGGEEAMRKLRHLPRSQLLDREGSPIPALSIEADLCKFWRALLMRVGVDWVGQSVFLTPKNTPPAPEPNVENEPAASNTRPTTTVNEPASPQLQPSQRMTPTPAEGARQWTLSQGNSSRSSATRCLQELDLQNVMESCKEVFLNGVPKDGVSIDFVATALHQHSKKNVRFGLQTLYHQSFLLDFSETGDMLVRMHRLMTVEDTARRIIATVPDDLREKAFAFDARVISASTFQNVGADDPAKGFYLVLQGAGRDTTSSRVNHIGPVTLTFSPIPERNTGKKMSEKWCGKWVELEKAMIRIKSPLKKTIAEDNPHIKMLELKVDDDTSVEILKHGVSQEELSERHRMWHLKAEARTRRSLADFYLLEHKDDVGDIVGEVRYYRGDSPLLPIAGDNFRMVQIRVAENPQNVIVLLNEEQQNKFASLTTFTTVLLLTKAQVFNPKTDRASVDRAKNRLVAQDIRILPHDDPRVKTLKNKLKDAKRVSDSDMEKRKRRQTIVAGPFKMYRN